MVSLTCEVQISGVAIFLLNYFKGGWSHGDEERYFNHTSDTDNYFTNNFPLV